MFKKGVIFLNPQVFQMLAAVVDPDVLDLIPGDKNTFFRKLEKCLNVSYTDAGMTCLLQGRYVHDYHYAPLSL